MRLPSRNKTDGCRPYIDCRSSKASTRARSSSNRRLLDGLGANEAFRELCLARALEQLPSRSQIL